MKNWIGTLRVKVKVEMSLWDAIKLRIAGMDKPFKKKITIDELIKEGKS